MQDFKDVFVTAVGQDLLDSVNAGKDKITYTRAVLSAQDVSSLNDAQIKALTDLTDQKQSNPITIVDRNSNTINIATNIDNSNVVTEFQYSTIGWYAKGSQEMPNEVLLAVSPSRNGMQTMPANSSSQATYSFRPNFYMALSYNAQVVAQPTAAGAINGNDLKQAIAELGHKGLINNGDEIPDNIDIHNLHNTGISYVNGEKVGNLPPGFSGNGYLISVSSNDTQKDGYHVLYDTYTGRAYIEQYNNSENTWSIWTKIAVESDLDSLKESLEGLIGKKVDQTTYDADKKALSDKLETFGTAKSVEGNTPDAAGDVKLKLAIPKKLVEVCSKQFNSTFSKNVIARTDKYMYMLVKNKVSKLDKQFNVLSNSDSIAYSSLFSIDNLNRLLCLETGNPNFIRVLNLNLEAMTRLNNDIQTHNYQGHVIRGDQNLNIFIGGSDTNYSLCKYDANSNVSTYVNGIFAYDMIINDDQDVFVLCYTSNNYKYIYHYNNNLSLVNSYNIGTTNYVLAFDRDQNNNIFLLCVEAKKIIS